MSTCVRKVAVRSVHGRFLQCDTHWTSYPWVYAGHRHPYVLNYTINILWEPTDEDVLHPPLTRPLVGWVLLDQPVLLLLGELPFPFSPGWLWTTPPKSRIISSHHEFSLVMTTTELSFIEKVCTFYNISLYAVLIEISSQGQQLVKYRVCSLCLGVEIFKCWVTRRRFSTSNFYNITSSPGF